VLDEAQVAQQQAEVLQFIQANFSFPEVFEEIRASCNKDLKLLLARKFIGDAQSFRTADPKAPFTRRRIKVYMFQKGALWRWVVFLLGVCHIALGFTEPASNRVPRVWEPGGYRGSGFFLANTAVECVAVCVYVTDLVLLGVGSGSHIFSTRRYMLHLLCVLCLCVDFAMEVGMTGPFERWFRFLRPLLFVLNTGRLVWIADSLVATSQRLLEYLLLVVVFLVTYSIASVHLLADVYVEEIPRSQLLLSETRYLDINETHVAVPMQQNFCYLGASLLSSSFLATFDVWPDIGLAAWKQDGIFTLFQLVFMVTSVLILAIPISFVFESFKQHNKARYKQQHLNQRKNLIWAFYTLDDNDSGGLEFDEFSAVCEAVVPVRMHRYVRQYFQLLDDDRSGHISLDEFLQLCDILLFKKVDEELTNPCCIRLEKRRVWFNSRVVSCTGLVTSTAFKVLVLVAVLGNIVVLGSYEWGMDQQAEERIFMVDDVFLAFFTVEIVLKLIGLGWLAFWRDSWNKFDFVTVVPVTVFTIVIFVLESESALSAGSENDSVRTTFRIGRVSQITRVTRAVRFFRVAKVVKVLRLATSLAFVFKRVHNILATLFLVIPNVRDTYCVLLLVFYFWGMVGQSLFALSYEERFADSGGMFPDNPMLSFAHPLNTFMSLFQVLVVADFSDVLYVTADALNHKAHSGWNTLIVVVFLFSFFFVVVLVVLNLITALVIDMFQALEHKRRKEVESSGELESDQKASDNKKEPSAAQELNKTPTTESLVKAKSGAIDLHKMIFRFEDDHDPKDRSTFKNLNRTFLSSSAGANLH